MKQAMIFAAGLGTRLKPLTDTMPKALVRVGKEPLLKLVVLKLKNAGFERIVVNVHHFADQIEEYLAANQNFGVDVRISDERKKLLETGGGIRKAADMFETTSPILIHNVDILSNVDLADCYAKADDADATLLVSERETSRYLLFNETTMRMEGWTNISTGEVKSPYEMYTKMAPLTHMPDGLRKYAFSGIHIFHPAIFPLMNNYPEKFGIMDFYIQNCKTARIKGLVMPDLHLLDVGKQNTLEAAERFLKDNPI
jgi:MurNAc alpha-1-phosphate uridylyltransferase